MLKSRMSFVVSEINKTEKFLYHQTFYEGQSDGFCMISVQNFTAVWLFNIIPFVRSIRSSFFRSPHARSARGGMDKKFQIMHWDVAGERIDLPLEHRGQRRLPFTRRFLKQEVSDLPSAWPFPRKVKEGEPRVSSMWCFLLTAWPPTTQQGAVALHRDDRMASPSQIWRGREVRTSESRSTFSWLLKIWLQEFDGLGTKKKKLAAQPSPQWAKKVRKVRAGHLVPQGPLERRPCSASTNCTPPGPRTAARADRAWIRALGASTHWRTGARRVRRPRGPGASWALGAGARAGS